MKEFVRLLVISLLSSLLLGIAGRLIMRWIAMEAGIAASGSWSGSVQVVAFGMLAGTPIALLFLLIRPKVRIRAPWFGLGVGLSILAVAAMIPPPSARSALEGTPDTPLYTMIAFGVLLSAWMIALDLYATRRSRRAETPMSG